MRKKSGELGEIPRQTKEVIAISKLKDTHKIKRGSAQDIILDKIANQDVLNTDELKMLEPLTTRKTKKLDSPTLATEVNDVIEEIRAKLPKKKTTRFAEPTVTIDTEIVEPDEPEQKGFFARLKGMLTGK